MSRVKMVLMQKNDLWQANLARANANSYPVGLDLARLVSLGEGPVKTTNWAKQLEEQGSAAP
jgi:hypothetical protein